MKARAWHDEKSGWWLSEVQGCGMRVTGSGRTRQSAVDSVLDRGWKFCASIRELSEAGALPLAERRGLLTVETVESA
ncbi:MAG TPA: hypothetical protein VGH54_28940 [Mycobacterium sp.]|uniref:hypothetical protein n=1 Tax=Mycobacterium sp. TaxID=1785 RepID=UPI002F3F3689